MLGSARESMLNKPVQEQTDWELYKKVRKANAKDAVKSNMNYNLRNHTEKYSKANEDAKMRKDLNYNNLGDSKAPKFDPLDFKESRNKIESSQPSSTREHSKEKVLPQTNHESLPELQSRINTLIRHLFAYWAKKRSSKYIRIEKFVKSLLIMGLAPNEQFLTAVLEQFESNVPKPGFIKPKVPHGKRVPLLKDLYEQKPSNKYFVYSVDRYGNLKVSHISLEAMLELYTFNKHSMNLQGLLKKQLCQSYIKNLTKKLAKQNYGLNLKQQERDVQIIQFSAQQYND